MSLQLPEGLDPAMLAQMAGAAGGAPMGPPMPPDRGSPLPLPQGLQQDQPDQPDPLEVLQACIQSLPGLLHALPNPQDVQDATQALLILTKIQSRLMSAGQAPNGAQAG